MSNYGRVFEKSIVELIKEGVVEAETTIVLDPRASQTLTYDDLSSSKYVVIGGILGDNPPRGRTQLLITNRMPPGVRSFNIGDGQYSIDGAVYFISYMWHHRGLNGFTYVDGVSISTDYGEIFLPFRYPVVNGKPLLADGLEYYLKFRRLSEEIWREITGLGSVME